MAQTQAIQRRIRSVKNAGQITKALEVVAASRMRRIQASVANISLYAGIAEQIMQRISPSQEAQQHPYFKKGAGKTRLYIIFNSDRGQAGAFNSNLFNMAHQHFMQDKSDGLQSDIIVFGRKGTGHFARLAEVAMVGAYEDVADIPEANVFSSVLGTIEEGFADGRLESVHILYTQFVSSLSQRAVTSQLLPIQLQANQDTEVKDQKVYEFEPGIEAVLAEALRIYFEAKLMAARVESAASENAMRMIAMGNAHRNASDLADDLTLELNSVRQAAITQEIAEITGGAEAITT